MNQPNELRHLRVGLLGCGVVGSGVVQALAQSAQETARKRGVVFEVVQIAVRDVQRPRPSHVNRALLCRDWRRVCQADNVDVVVEVMGGLSPAKEAIEAALTNGKHVVSANKQLLAAHGEELSAIADRVGKSLLFDASVLGAVPALHLLDTYFGANQVRSLRGIVNGTCNYILTQMRTAGQPFAQALAEAQTAGYAESDPSADIEGADALAKLQILARKAFGRSLPAGSVQCSGIEHVDKADLVLAAELGCKLKQVAQLQMDPDGVLSARVGVALVAPDDPLYGIDGVQNGLVVSSDLAGDLLLAGAGAGALPTASAIVEDLLKLEQPVQTSGSGAGETGSGAPVSAATPASTSTTHLLRDVAVDGVFVRVSHHRGTAMAVGGGADLNGQRLQTAFKSELRAAFGAQVRRVDAVEVVGVVHDTSAWLVRGHLSPSNCQAVAQRLWGSQVVCYPVYGVLELPAALDTADPEEALLAAGFPLGLSSI